VPFLFLVGGCECGVVMNTPASSSVNRTRSGVSVAKYEFPWQVGPLPLLRILYRRE
jgi:hypothetical protein